MNVRIIIMVFFPVFAIAQAPQKINFQSILRNSSGEVIGNSSVSLKISILSGSINGSSVYSETHAKITDASGLISLQIGNGTVVSGIFANIDWGGLSHFIKLEADFSGGSNYVVLGTQELMSVPYALYASKTDTSALNLTSRLATKLNATDTVSLSNRINANNANSGSFDTSLLNLTSRLATKLNVTDTAILSNRIDTKAPINSPTFTGTVGGISKTMVGLGNVDNTSDAGKPISSATQTALSNKLNKTDTSLLNLVSRFETKLNIADTSNMLLAYKTGLNSKLNKTDTASLSNRIDAILTKTDTASLSNRIDLKLTKTDTASLSNRIDLKLTKTDTASLSNRIDFKLTKTDTASLSNRIDFKLTKTDTASLSNRIDLKLTKTDTTSLSNRIDLKLTKTDTASLSNRIDAKLTKTDTASLSNRIDAKLTKTDTASLSNRIDAKLTKTDTASLSERINTKLNSSVIDLGNQTGIIIYWDENLRKFRTLAPGTEGQVLKIVSGIPVWGTVATASVPAFSLCGTTISDIDGNSYNTVLIGAQCWTKENLRVRRYNNGTSILFNATGGSGGSSTTWTNLTIGAHTIYAHDSMTTPSNRTKYGYLYNWYAAKGIYTTGNIASTDTLNICPEGWHVPTDAEWTTLTTDLGGESVAGRMMKSIGTAFWSSQSAGTDNSSGFSALPGGYRSSGGSFYDIRSLAFFWSATEGDNYSAWGRLLNDSSGGVTKNYYNKTFGASVRCLRDY